MQKRKFTIVTELKQNNNSELITYFDESRHLYNKALRETFHTIKNAQDFNKGHHTKYLQNKYDILRRTANSIISDAQGKYNALIELKKYEKKQLKYKIAYLETKLIPKLVQQRADNNTMLRLKMNISLVKHRNLKLKLVAKYNKLNHLKQKLDNLSYQIESGKLKLCFGTKSLLKTNYTKFVEQRDNQMSFVGSKDESSGNQMLQLTYNPKNNQFMIQLRKDFGEENKKAKGNNKYVHGKVYFRHHKHHIVDILRHGYSPLTYKIIKQDNRYYLYCTFEIQHDDEDVITRSSYGTIGLDFNKGFVTLSETNQYGHLVQTQLLPYRFKQGTKTTNDLRQIANHVVKLSVQKGKDICIENLNFNRTKAKTESKHGKKYNDMIHSLSYRQFMETIESVAYRNLVKVIKVNPAWTSWIAKKTYCPSMKLNTHIGASFVIARRGQGFQDSVS